MMGLLLIYLFLLFVCLRDTNLSILPKKSTKKNVLGAGTILDQMKKTTIFDVNS